jgi:MOSC domain-containing protein YiiM
MQPVVAAVFVGQPATLEDDRGRWRSSIRRTAVLALVEVTLEGLRGDRVTQPYHGGPGAAVCVHLLDHYRFWNAKLGLGLAPGGMGENLTLDAILEGDVCAGDIVSVGTALFQVSGPRTPCANLARHLGHPNWVKKTVLENRTGFYLRVLEPGRIRAEDRWLLRDRLNPGASIPAINRCMYLDSTRSPPSA